MRDNYSPLELMESRVKATLLLYWMVSLCQRQSRGINYEVQKWKTTRSSIAIHCDYSIICAHLVKNATLQK